MFSKLPPTCHCWLQNEDLLKKRQVLFLKQTQIKDRLSLLTSRLKSSWTTPSLTSHQAVRTKFGLLPAMIWAIVRLLRPSTSPSLVGLAKSSFLSFVLDRENISCSLVVISDVSYSYISFCLQKISSQTVPKFKEKEHMTIVSSLA